MSDPFLEYVGVSNEPEAMRNSIRAALQHNLFYNAKVGSAIRRAIRSDWAELIRKSVKDFYMSGSPVAENTHFKQIQSISKALSKRYADSLHGGRLRIATSQKALNLYLKFLWKLNKIVCPPHCPVDRIVLRHANIDAVWTQSDSIVEYKDWIKKLKKKAMPHCLAEWEYNLWNHESKKTITDS